MKDLFSRIHPLVAIAPAAATADNTAWVSSIIDRKNYESLTFVLATGGEVDADATFAVTVDEGDASNLSDASAVAAADLLGTTTLAGFRFDDDNESRKIGYRGNKRYVRLTVTPSANTGAAYLAALAILGHPQLKPTPNPPV